MNALVVAALVAVALAGCAQKPNATCQPTQTCAPVSGNGSLTPTQGPPGGTSNGPVPPLGRDLKFENCTGLYGAFTGTYDSVRPFVPKDFYIRGQTPDLADLGFVATTCKRMVNGTRIVENASWFTTFAWVIPKNGSWAPDFNSRYVFDMYFSDQGWASEFVKWGAKSSKADFTITEKVPNPSFPLWQIANGSERYSVDYHAVGEPGDKNPGGVYHWFGTGPYVRVDEAQHERLGGDPQVGVLDMEGNSNLQRAFGAPKAEWLGGPHFDRDATFVPFDKVFNGGK